VSGDGFWIWGGFFWYNFIKMKVKELLNQKKTGFDGVLEFYKNDIAAVRTNRATPALVENVPVDYYDQKLKIKELASITVPEPRTIVIQPWDKGAIEPIASAITKSELGLNPAVEGNAIRLTLPPLTEESRKELLKLLKRKTEEARIKLRRAREELWDKIQKMERSGEIPEDDKFWAKDELQKIIDEGNKKIEEMEKKKEQELLV